MVRPLRLVGTLRLLLALLCTAGGSVFAAPPLPPAPASTAISLLTIATEQEHAFVVNGAFGTGDPRSYTYSASLTGGGSLPSWIKLDRNAGTFTINAPASSRGEVLAIRVTATDGGGGKTSEDFHLVVDDSSLGCVVESNNDGLARLLECKSGKTKLRGYTSTDSYRWTGPDGFSSSSKEPTVSNPGLYLLSTSGCARKQAVEVLANAGSCTTEDDNAIPVARIDADKFTGTAPLTVSLDGLMSQDPDGSIIDYRWTWNGVTATGPTPTATFEAGTYQVVLTVTDNTGAKSTDYVTLEVTNPSTVVYKSYWLEAECADVGSNWQVGNNTSASGSSFVVAKQSSTSRPPSDVPDNRVTFTLDNAEKGSYTLFARVSSPDTNSDSYWVRVNGKEWINWNSNIASGQGWQWNEMLGYQPYLNDGTNKIEFAFRESDTRLDKINLNSTGQKPSGEGQAATNCYEAANQAPVARATATPGSGVGPMLVSFDGSGSSDSDGSIKSYRWSWSGGGADGVTASTTLGAGTYVVTLTVTDNDGATNTDEVTVNVSQAESASSDEHIWLEVECGIVGDRWTTRKSSAASNGTFVVVTDRNAYDAPPADVKDTRVRFLVNASKRGAYKLFARVNAPTTLDDSFWVRINGGPWIKWYNRITAGVGFHWNKADDLVQLNVGANIIDFAYRENGTQFDKLYLTTTKIKPSGTGSSATNCSADGTADSKGVWAEAECATVGKGWEVREASGASNGNYVLYTGDNSMDQPATTYRDKEVRFTVNTPVSGEYELFLRMAAPDAGSNSFWIQVDDSKWLEFWSEEDGTLLTTNGFQWRKVNADGNPFSVKLSAGSHDIVVANRESGTRLDKIYLSLNGVRPAGLGGSAPSCDASSIAFGNPSMLTTEGSTDAPQDLTEGVTLYPNPVADDLNVTLTSAYSGPVDVSILDVTGRSVQVTRFEKAGDQLAVSLDVRRLPSGVYRLRVIEGEEQRVESFVKH